MNRCFKSIASQFHWENADFLILLFVFTVYPFIVVPGPLPYFYGPRYIVLALVSIIALLTIIKKGISFIRKADLALFAFFFFLLISTFLSDNIAEAWIGNGFRFTGASTYLFCGLLFTLASRIESEKRILLIEFMVYTATLVSFIAILQNYGLNIVPHEAYRASFHSYGTLGNPNFLATYAVFILPASMMLYLYQKKHLWLTCSAFIFGALLVSLTRGSWLAFAGIFMIMAYHVYKNIGLRKRLLTISIVFIATYVILTVTSSIQLTERVSTISIEIANVTENTNTSSSIRFYVWQESLQIIKNNWAFGIGADNLSIPMPQGHIEDKAHNVFIEIAVTMGLFALISFLCLLYYCLNQKGDWVQSLLSFMIVAYIFQSQFNIDVIINLPLFWITLGLAQAVNGDYIYIFSTDLEQPLKVHKAKFNNILQIVTATAFILFILLILFIFYFPRETVVEIEGHGRYEGQVRGLNTFHGYGELVMDNGVIYRGIFKHGLFDGQGTLSYMNGSYYAGEFKQGYFDGRGVLVNADGTTKEGIFEYGKMIEQLETE